MSENKISHLEVIKVIKNFLESQYSHKEPVMTIAGGYLCDKFFGLEPKDCDIWTKIDFNTDIKDVVGRLQTYFNRHPEYNLDLQPLYCNYNERKELDTFKTVICKITGDIDIPIDLILLDSNAYFTEYTYLQTASKIIENFDCSLSKLYVEHGSLNYYLEYDNMSFVTLSNNFLKSLLFDSIEFYPFRDNKFFGVPNSDNVFKKRLDRYRDKYAPLGFKVCYVDELGKLVLHNK